MAEPVRASLPARIEHPTLDLPTREKLIVMVAVLLGLFLSALDQTIVGVALPRIVSDLKGSDLYTWVVTAYLLTSTITVPIYGKLGDVFGRQRMLIVGILIFLAGSALSGLSQSMGELIVFRAIQGCGAGALFPISLAVIGDLFTPRERGRYQGLFGAVFGVSFIVGPFLGGIITDDISWHWIFYVNVPVGIVALYAISTRLPNLKTTAARLRDLDFSGIAIFTVGVVPILIGLTFKGLTGSGGNLYGWTSWQVGGLILLGLLIMAGFIVNEARARQPIIPLDLFSTRTLAATNVAVFMIASCMFAAVIFIPLYYQVVQGGERHRLRLLDVAAAGRPHRHQHRCRLLPHQDRPLQGAAPDRPRRAHRRKLPAHPPQPVDVDPHPLALAGPDGFGDRSLDVGLHRRDPERGTARAARHRHQHPHLPPPGRRRGRAGGGGHRLHPEPLHASCPSS